MPAPKKGKRFGKSASHQRLMLANLAAHLIAAEAHHHHREPRPRRCGPYVEKLVTKAKVGGVHKQRQVVVDDPRQGRHAQALRRDRARATPTATAATRGS